MAGTVERTTARSRPDCRMPALTPAATNPLAAVTLIRAPPTAAGPRVSRVSEREVRVLDRLSGRALAEVVDRADDDGRPGRPIGEDRDLRGVGPLYPGELRGHVLGQDAHRRRGRVGGLEQGARLARVRLDVGRRDEPAPDGEEMRDEADGEAERLRDLRLVLVSPDLVGRDVLEHRAGVRARLEGLARAGDARLGVDDHAARRVDDPGERLERQQRGGRVAAGIRDQPGRRRRELGDRIRPCLELGGERMREAVPLVVERSRPSGGGRRRGRRPLRARAARAPPTARDRGRRRRGRRRSPGPPRSSRRRERGVRRCGRGGGRARSRRCPASESEPSANRSSSGWASTRSSVSCPE